MPVQLKRGFGYWTILALVIGSIFGTTHFFGTPIGAGYSGNLLIAAWIALSLIALYIAGVFGELSAMFPKAGGAYEFSKQAYGKSASFMIAWVAWLFGSISTAVIVIAAVNSLGLGISQFETFLLGVVLIVLLNAVAYVGLQASSLMLIALGLIMVAIPAFIIVKGITAVNPANFQPFASHPLPAIFVTLFFMAEAYFGWESATYLAEETKNPTRVIPRALVQATAFMGVLGLLLIVITLGIIPWQELSGITAPVTVLASRLYGSAVGGVFTAGIFLALIGTAAATVLSMPRLLMALARDRLFLGQFKSLHPAFRTPTNAILFQTVALVVLLLIGFANYVIMLELLVPIAAFLYVAIMLSVVVLRRKMPSKERPFRVPFGKAGPLAASLFFVVIVAAWLFTVPGASITFQTSLSLILIGVPLYFLIELYYDPKMITQVNDMLAYASLFLQKISRSGSSVRKRVLQFLGDDIRGKTVFEYGCGIGSLTLKLLEAVGDRGTVFATHFSGNNVKIANKRVEMREWESQEWKLGNARIVHDPEQMRRVYPEIGYADAVVSIGMLGYVQDLGKVLRELYAIMPVGGKICFVEHSGFFHVIPDAELLASDSRLERIFRDAGFSVRVERKKGLLWNTVFVFGIKFSGDTAFI